MRAATLTRPRRSSPIIELLANAYEQAALPERSYIRKINEHIAQRAEQNVREMNLGRAPADHHGKPTGAVLLTAFRLENAPVAILLNHKKIGGEEFLAAQDIEKAFRAKESGLGFKPLSMERVDGGAHRDWPEDVARAVRRYDIFANHWSNKAKQGFCPMLSIVIKAVVDHWSFRAIEEHYGFQHGRGAKILIAGLRDYAARAGWAPDKRQGDQWKVLAAQALSRR